MKDQKPPDGPPQKAGTLIGRSYRRTLQGQRQARGRALDDFPHRLGYECRAPTEPCRSTRLPRQSVSSGYDFEDTYGYSRAVRVGNQVFVSGTTARAPQLDGDAYAQMTGAVAIVAAALGEAGAELRHVVRTIIYVVDMADAA